MPEKNTFTKKHIDDLPGQAGKPGSILNRPVSLGILAFLVFAGLFSILTYQRYLILKQTQKKEAYEIANTAKDKLEQALENSLSATKILSFFIDNNGVVSNFDSVAAEILNSNKDLDVLELVPGGVIRYVYPLKGNENIIGYDILKDSTRNKEAFKAIEKNELFFSGPFELRQGGFGIVGRLPVFRKGQFWGFSAVVIKMSTLLEIAGIDSSDKNGYYFQLSKINPDTRKEELFVPHNNRPVKEPLTSLDIPKGEWKLSVTAKGGYEGLADILTLALIGFVFSVFSGIFVFIVVQRPQKLDELVRERTRQLKESEENYKILFEKSPLPLWIYDLESLKFLEVNDAAVNLYGYSRKEFLKMDLLAIRREEDIPVFLADNNNVSDELREAGVWRHIKKNGAEIEVLIFSRNIFYKNRRGRLVLLMDVSEKIRTEKDLIRSEEKYRSLIEHASDGIVITNLDGNILEVNDSICTMSGFGIEEMIGKHLHMLLPEEDIEQNPLRFNDLMQGKSLLHERRLLKKDGTVMEIEVNSKMASTHTLIGFIRDITERKKNEERLRYQARLLESVSDAVTSLDMNRCIVSWNQACQDLYGFTKEEVIGKRIPELVTFEFPGSSQEAVFKQVFGEDQWKGEFNFIHPKTKIKTHLLSSINLLKKKEGGIIGFIITSRDITDRKNAEEEVNKSNERFELIAQATNEAVWDHDFNKNETWGNKKLYSLYGFDPGAGKINFEMFLGRIHADDRGGIAERMKTAMDGSVTSLSEEFRFKTASGEYRNFYDRAYIKYDEEGKPLRVLGAMQDITDREIIKKQIIKEKELSDSIINSLPGVFYLYNKEGKFLRWNKNFESVTGYSGEEVHTMHPLDFFDKQDHTMMAEKIGNVFVAGEDHVEANFLLKNKQKVLYYFTGLAIEYEGETCLMGVGLDLSEREEAAKIIRESEEKYRTLVEQASDGIFIADKEGRFLIVNSSGYNMSQYSAEELKSLTIYDLVLPADIEKDPFHFSEMQNGRVARTERRMKRKDGTLLEVEVTAKFISGERFLAFVRDVSEREKAAKIIRQSEEKYRIMIEQASDGIFIASPDAYFIDVNSAGCRMLGYSKEELYKMKFTSLIPPGDSSNNPVQFPQLHKGDTVINERRLIRKDGSMIDVEISAKVLFDGRYQSIVRDITERKKADIALRESEERYRALVENAPEALVVFDVNTQKFVSVSKSATRLFGMSEEELLKIGPVTLSPEYQPDGRSSAEAARINIQKAIEGEKPSFEWIHIDSSGNTIPCEIWLVRLPSESGVLVRGSIVDITERKKAEEKIYQSEQKYRLLFYNNPLPMWMATIPELDIIDVNESAVKQYGYSREEFLKLNTGDLRSAEDMEHFLNEVDKMEPGTINTRAWRHKKKDGTIIQVETYTHQIMYEGRLVWLCLSHDVTEKYNAKELLQKSYEDIRQLASNLQSIREDERTNIAREIHDELGQQLTGLKMDMHWLTRKIKNADEEMNNKMKESIELINATITSVRKIATDLRPSILDDLGLMAALEWQGEEFEKRSGTKVEFINNAGDLQVKPEVATAIFRIYQELLTNIARHANAGLVTASLVIADKTLYFSIKDNGVGFNTDTINSKKTLGLLGIKERTLLMGGAYEIKTRPGEGSESIITIPLDLVKNGG